MTSPTRSSLDEPPPEQVSTLIADAGISISRHPDHAIAKVRLSLDVPLAGLVGLLADTAGGLLALDTIAPLRIATSQLALHLAMPNTEGEVEATARLLRRGRHAAVTQIDVRRLADGALVGVATLTFAIIGEQRPNGEPTPAQAALGELTDPGDGGEVQPSELLASPRLTEMLDIGELQVDDRRATLTINMEPRLRNSFQALNGGILTACMANTAAAASHGLLGPGATAIQLTQSFLAPGRGEHLHVVAEQLATPLPGGALVEVTMTDPEHDDRTVAHAHVIVIAGE